MPKISGYPDGGAVQASDQLVVNRGGKNYRVVNEITEVIGSFLGAGTVPASSTRYSAPFKTPFDSSLGSVGWPEGGTLRDMILRTGSTQPASGNLTITLVVNGVDTAMVITVPAGSASGNYSDAVNQVTISPNDLLRWKIVNNATASSAGLNGLTMVLVKN